MKLLPEKVSYRAVIELVVILGLSFAVVLMYFGSSKGVETFKKKIIKDEKFMTEEGTLYLVYEAKVEKKTKTFQVMSPLRVIQVTQEVPVKGDERIKVVERTQEVPVKGDERIKVVDRVIEKPVKTKIPKVRSSDFGLNPDGKPADTKDVKSSLKRIEQIKIFTVGMLNSREDGKQQAKEILALNEKIVFLAETSENLGEFRRGLPPVLPKLFKILIEGYRDSMNTNDGVLEFVEGVMAACGKALESTPELQ